MRKKEIYFDIITFSEYSKIENQYTDDFIKNSRCVKIRESADHVEIAISEGFENKIELLEIIHAPKKIKQVIVTHKEFAEFVGNQVEKTVEYKTSETSDSENELASLVNINSDAPIVNIINAIFLEAIRKGASDIHIQCDRELIVIRLRIDGVLQIVKKLDKRIFNSFASRIKVMANLNVMENRLCQDGRITVSVENKKVDFRVSIVPTVNGQSIVLRLFNTENKTFTLESLGLSKNTYTALEKSLEFPYGMILATGPTGSGKTTTLHALLLKMDREHLKIVSIEDPVEEVIEGIDQIQVNNEIGLGFDSILRRVLRQDPDVIMIGEIRDEETAELAVRSALTGHLILSTLHTNDSVSCITRLQNLGIEPYLISSVLRLCLAQRLVRKLCTACNGNGCIACNHIGYKGRMVVSEVFENTSEVAQLIEEHKTENEIKAYLLKTGFITLEDDAQSKLQLKITTKEELLREGFV